MPRAEPLKCDVLVIGGGPGGATAAIEACRAGASVILLERRPRPDQWARACGGMVPAKLALRDLHICPRRIVGHVGRVVVELPSGARETWAVRMLVIDRPAWDADLLDHARQVGVNVLPGARARKLQDALIVEQGQRRFDIRAFTTIAADGALSAFAPDAAAGPRHAVAWQTTVPLTRPLLEAIFYFDRPYRCGYAWLFPRGRVAHVGLGSARSGRGHDRRAALRELLQRLVRDGVIASDQAGHIRAGRIPTWGPPPRAVVGRTLLVGDAAGQTHPITGAGIHSAIVCGRLAGRAGGRAALSRDPGVLAEYEEGWREVLGERLLRAKRKRQLLETQWDATTDLDALIRRTWPAFDEYWDD